MKTPQWGKPCSRNSNPNAIPIVSEAHRPVPAKSKPQLMQILQSGVRVSRVTGLLLRVGVLALFIAGCGFSILELQPFGRRHWVFGTVGIGLACLLIGIPKPLRRHKPSGIPDPITWSARSLRYVLIWTLTAWLALIGWSSLSPGGPPPHRKSSPSAIRVVTWNVLRGDEGGPISAWTGWSVRKHALRRAIAVTKPDILCVQEALPGQVQFLQSVLPSHHHVGVGRDNGEDLGEHCAIFFEADRFQEDSSGTFWLEEPIDRPAKSATLGPKRICTWVRLLDRRDGRFLRVYNAHFYLTERARRTAARIVLGRIATGDSADAVILASDFNASPSAGCRQIIDQGGLVPSSNLLGRLGGQATYQFYGIRTFSFDEILLSGDWRILNRQILDVKPDNTFPSDHFGVMADVMLRDHSARP
jgi:endonuclease/exonuclease/phosphatase family metal-dependent hydrolase